MIRSSRICSYIKIKIVVIREISATFPIHIVMSCMAFDLITLIFDTCLTTFPSKPLPYQPIPFPYQPFPYKPPLITKGHYAIASKILQAVTKRQKVEDCFCSYSEGGLSKKVYVMWGSLQIKRGREWWWYVSPYLWYVSPCLWYVSPCLLSMVRESMSMVRKSMSMIRKSMSMVLISLLGAEDDNRKPSRTWKGYVTL